MFFKLKLSLYFIFLLGCADSSYLGNDLNKENRKYQDFCKECPRFVEVNTDELEQELLLVSEAEITVGQYNACIMGGGCSSPANTAALEYDENWPIVYVSWAQAYEYILWLSMLTGKDVDFLSGDEWQYLALEGKDKNVRKYNLNKIKDNCIQCVKSNDRLTDVKNSQPNKYGLYGMFGNVQEWTKSCEDNDLKNFFGDDKSVYPPFCEMHVVKGGSYKSNPEKNYPSFNLLIYAGCFDKNGRPTKRVKSHQCIGYYQHDLGFRVVIRR